MNRFRLCIWLLICSLFAASAQSQNAAATYWHNRFNAGDIQVGDVAGLNERISDGQLHLRLSDFLALVLRNAPDVQLSRLDIYTPGDQLTAAKSPFDPALNLSFSALRQVTPLGYSFGGTSTGAGTGTNQFTLPATINSLSQTSILDYKQLLPTGQTFETNFTGNRSSGNSYSFPFLSGVLNFILTQPLLQNRTNLQNLTPIRVAKTEILITSKLSEAAINTSLGQAAQQYWNAVLARENIRVNQQALTLAQKSYEHDKQALDLGALSKLDILQSESQVASRERDVVDSQYQYKVLLDGLRRLIGADMTAAMRGTELVLDDDPAILPDKSGILPFEDALAKALQARPESAAAEAAIKVDDLNARASRDALLPVVNLGVQGGSSGPGLNQLVAGGVVGLNSASPSPGLSTTLQQVLDFKFPSYGASLTATFPFRNSTAKASLADALVSRARDKFRQRQTVEQITLDVRRAIHEIELADATIKAAGKAQDLAARNVDAERQKYELGVSTAFEYLNSQAQLATADSAVVNAYVNYQLAFIDYQGATQTLTGAFGMKVGIPSI